MLEVAKNIIEDKFGDDNYVKEATQKECDYTQLKEDEVKNIHDFHKNSRRY